MKIINSIIRMERSDKFSTGYVMDKLCEYGFDVVRWAVVESDSNFWMINVSHISA